MTQLFSVKSSGGNTDVTPAGIDKTALPDGYSSLVATGLNGKQVLYGYNKTTNQFDVYDISDAAPFLSPVLKGSTGLELHQWDILRAFTLGNKQYLMSYEAKHGNLGFYEIKDDYTLSKPYVFMNQRSWPTQNFSEVTPFVCVGLLYVLCYDGVKGTVAIFSLDVIAGSQDGIPPLNMLNSWYHQWAKGWDNFSFFQLGQSNFFFKINKAKLNVNIDHVLDIPAQGSVEIGSYLQAQMPDALDVKLATIIAWSNGEPYLATCTAAGSLNIYHIHADCQGWTKLNNSTIDAGTSMLSYLINGTSYLLVY
jgi:hypothetical protein